MPRLRRERERLARPRCALLPLRPLVREGLLVRCECSARDAHGALVQLPPHAQRGGAADPPPSLVPTHAEQSATGESYPASSRAPRLAPPSLTSSPGAHATRARLTMHTRADVHTLSSLAREPSEHGTRVCLAAKCGHAPGSRAGPHGVTVHVAARAHDARPERGR